MFNVKRAILITVAATAATLSFTGTGASADDKPPPIQAIPRVCEGAGTIYYESHTARYIGNPSTRVYGQSGGTLSFSVGKSTTVSGSLQATASAEAGVIFSKVSASVSVSVGLSKTVTVTIGYSWTVPSTQSTGWIEMGSHGYQISWTKGYYTSPCTWHQTGSGSLLGATANTQFAHS